MGPLAELEDALKEYNKKFKDKSGNKWDERSEPAKKGKYTFLERSYEDDDDEAQDQVKKEDADEEQTDSKLPRQTQRLMELIFNQNHFNAVLESIGYNANKLPLGKLSKTTLKQGFEHLQELASLIKHPSLSQNKYGTSQKEVSRSVLFLTNACNKGNHSFLKLGLLARLMSSLHLLGRTKVVEGHERLLGFAFIFGPNTRSFHSSGTSFLAALRD